MPRARGRYRTDDNNDFLERVLRLEEKVDRMERVPRIGNTAIDKGDLTIKEGSLLIANASGTIVSQVGKLTTGEYGAAIDEGGHGLQQVPYIYAASVATQEPSSSSTFGDLATVGPTVTVPVRVSGKILVIISAQIQWISTAAAATVGGAYATIQMSGANTLAPLTAFNSILASCHLNTNVSAGTVSHAPQSNSTGAFVFTGLTPGDTTITMKYARQTGIAINVDISRRNLTVVNL
jgi:hypothetical protein